MEYYYVIMYGSKSDWIYLRRYTTKEARDAYVQAFYDAGHGDQYEPNPCAYPLPEKEEALEWAQDSGYLKTSYVDVPYDENGLYKVY